MHSYAWHGGDRTPCVFAKGTVDTEGLLGCTPPEALEVEFHAVG